MERKISSLVGSSAFIDRKTHPNAAAYVLSQKAFSSTDRKGSVKHWKQYRNMFASLTLDEQVASPHSLCFHSEYADGD